MGNEKGRGRRRQRGKGGKLGREKEKIERGSNTSHVTHILL